MSNKNEHHEDEQLENIEHVLSGSEKFIEDNQKMIINIVLAIVAVILAVMAYGRFVTAPKEAEAQSQLFAGEMLFAADSFQTAIQGDGNFMGFEYIADKYSSTTSGNLAKYYTGISYLNIGEYEQAIKYLNKFSAEGEMMPAIKAGAIGDAYAEQGDYTKAVTNFKKAASFDNNFTSPIYTKKCGIAYEANGDFKNAVACYEAIKADYPNSTEASDIDKYIARAQELAN